MNIRRDIFYDSRNLGTPLKNHEPRTILLLDIHGGRRSRAFPREYPKEDVALSRGFLRGYGRRNKTVLCRPRGISVREGGPALTFYREGRRSPTRPRSVFRPRSEATRRDEAVFRVPARARAFERRSAFLDPVRKASRLGLPRRSARQTSFYLPSQKTTR